MAITCPKCTHTADDTDEYGSPVTSCPKCGIIYARYNPDAVVDTKAKLKELKKKKPKDNVDDEAKPSFKERLSKPVVKRLIILLSAIPIAAVAWVGYDYWHTEKLKAQVIAEDLHQIELIKDKVKLALKDPDSAKFEKVIRHITAGCGYVNAKNSMGGYIGLKSFVVIPDGKVIFENDEDSDFMVEADVYCRDYFFSHDNYLASLQDKLNQAKERAARFEEMERERQRSNEEINRAIEKIGAGG